MQFLFVHQNFPGQFRHIAKALAQDDTHQIVAIGHFPGFQGASALDPKIQLFGYKTPKASHTESHYYLRDFEGHIRRGQEVVRLAHDLKKKAFIRKLSLLTLVGVRLCFYKIYFLGHG